jgi:glucose/arabinose dehydrogenase
MIRPLPVAVVLALASLGLGIADPAPVAPAIARIAPEALGKGAKPAKPWAKPALTKVQDGFDRPVLATHAGDGSGRLFVVEQTGRVWVIAKGARQPTPFLDARPLLGSTRSEQGLLGLAFHPRFKENGQLFIAYTDQQEQNAVARLVVQRDAPASVDLKSLTVLLAMEDPAANHNGGHLVFGPDGKLWIGTGDGGAANNLFKTAQNPDSLLGKMLTLDVDSPSARPAIWGNGLRNPWRYAFDRANGDLWIADVGQNKWEEVNLVAKAAQRPGLNFGWSRLEGAHCFDANPCTSSGTVVPVFAYPHEQGCSVTGGVVHRGPDAGALAGTYLFADYCSGRLWGIQQGAQGPVVAELAQTGLAVSSFGEDEQGSVYVVDHKGGVYRVTAP